MEKVYTIGYLGFSLHNFIKTLLENNINYLIDVRSIPKSNSCPEFDQDKLSGALKEVGIMYESLACEFGARQESSIYYTNGIMDFDKFIQSGVFLSGINRVNELVNDKKTIALMCKEIDPMECHRSIMVSRQLHRNGINILHLMPEEKIKSQIDIEKALVSKFIDEFFENKRMTLEEMIDRSYQLQNVSIGYRLKKKS